MFALLLGLGIVATRFEPEDPPIEVRIALNEAAEVDITEVVARLAQAWEAWAKRCWVEDGGKKSGARENAD